MKIERACHHGARHSGRQPSSISRTCSLNRATSSRTSRGQPNIAAVSGCPLSATARSSDRSSSDGRRRACSPTAGRVAEDLCRPGRHRDRERAPVHGTGQAQSRPHRGAGAADGDQRDPARDQSVANRRAAGLRHHRSGRADALSAPVSANVFTFDGEADPSGGIRQRGARKDAEALRRCISAAAGRDTAGRPRDPSTGDVVAIPDVLDDPEYAIGESAHVSGFRSVAGRSAVREGSRSARSPSAGPNPDRFRTSRSRCSRPSPTRR